ncbi:hypothetical protein B0H13DRAFT_2339589 [Mycena leptocephala]|nr:hypothetical protein B0H13DRAFT_2339589 [Mycena leptocephala]
MDASATQRFLDTNSNLRFKVFLVMMAVFPDAYATDTVRSLTTPQRDELRYRVRDIVRHMFFAAQIRQNEFRISYEPPVILRRLRFLLGAALSTFLAKKKSGNEAHLDFPITTPTTGSRPISHDSLADTFKYNEIIARWREIGIGARRGTIHVDTPRIPVSCEAAPPGIPSRSSDSLAAGDAVRAAGFKATLQAVESVIKKTATRRSMRVLAARMGETQGPPDDFFVKEEERALSEVSYGSMPGLVTPPRAAPPSSSRPAVYFLQRCAVGEGRLQGPLVDIPSSEKEELRLLALRLAGTVRFLSRTLLASAWKITAFWLCCKYDVDYHGAPGSTVRCGGPRPQALSICSPILQEFAPLPWPPPSRSYGHRISTVPRNGLLQELFYEIDLVPEE